MLQITILQEEGYDSVANEFVPIQSMTLDLEHSLASLSKWESKFERPFLNGEEKTHEETLAYIECMVLTPEFSPEVLLKLTSDNSDEISKYIAAKMTATTFSEIQSRQHSREKITAELVYYWMISFNIPFECQHWHLNRLLTLIRVCSHKNTPPKKKSGAEMAAERRALNAKRRAEAKSSG